MSLSDVPIALAVNGNSITTLVGSGCKNFIFQRPKTLSSESNFSLDLQVHTTIEQSAVAISKNGKRLAIASDEGHLTVVQLPYREKILAKKIHAQGVTDLAITADGELIATSSRDCTAYIFRTDSAELVQEIKPVMPSEMRTHIRAIRFAPSDPSLLFTIESNPQKGAWIAAWRSSSPTGGIWTPCSRIKASSDALTAFAINNSADMAAVSSSEGHVAAFRWNGTSFTQAWTTEPGFGLFRPPPPPHFLPVTSMHFSFSGAYLFTSSADSTIAVWPSRLPINWRGLIRLLLWLGAVLIVLFSVLVAEDHHLPKSILEKRERAQPYLEPHLTGLQSNVRPVFNRGLNFTRPHYLKVCKAVRPYSEKVNEKVAPAWRKSNEVWNAGTSILAENMEIIGGFGKAFGDRVGRFRIKKSSLRAKRRRLSKQGKIKPSHIYPAEDAIDKSRGKNQEISNEGQTRRSCGTTKRSRRGENLKCYERSVWRNLVLNVSESDQRNPIYSLGDAVTRGGNDLVDTGVSPAELPSTKDDGSVISDTDAAKAFEKDLEPSKEESSASNDRATISDVDTVKAIEKDLVPAEEAPIASDDGAVISDVADVIAVEKAFLPAEEASSASDDRVDITDQDAVRGEKSEVAAQERQSISDEDAGKAAPDEQKVSDQEVFGDERVGACATEDFLSYFDVNGEEVERDDSGEVYIQQE